MSGVLLIDPKYPHNVGAAVRACAVFGVPLLRWTGDRVTPVIEHRLPREERIRDYQERVDFRPVRTRHPLSAPLLSGMTPVCVEVSDSAESLVTFDHPENACYVFGPEDGDVPKGVRLNCHRFVTVPSDGCLNLAAAVNVVLYDRLAKSRWPEAFGSVAHEARANLAASRALG